MSAPHPCKLGPGDAKRILHFEGTQISKKRHKWKRTKQNKSHFRRTYTRCMCSLWTTEALGSQGCFTERSGTNQDWKVAGGHKHRMLRQHSGLEEEELISWRVQGRRLQGSGTYLGGWQDREQVCLRGGHLPVFKQGVGLSPPSTQEDTNFGKMTPGWHTGRGREEP